MHKQLQKYYAQEEIVFCKLLFSEIVDASNRCLFEILCKCTVIFLSFETMNDQLNPRGRYFDTGWENFSEYDGLVSLSLNVTK